MALMRRPTVYREEFAKQALELCQMGATDMELGEFFAVSIRTLHTWKAKHEDHQEDMEHSIMPRTGNISKRKKRKETVAVLGVLGLSLSLAGGGSAATAVPPSDTASRPFAPAREAVLYEEEVADVSLATFYVFDKEAVTPQLGVRLAVGGCGCGCGCGGCDRAGPFAAPDFPGAWVTAPPYFAKPPRWDRKASRRKGGPRPPRAR
jgi:hypothetical protein